MRYLIELSYNGTPYHGWQRQPNAITVQEILETYLTTLLRMKIGIVGAGRTDTGVHAKQMMAHFDHEHIIDREALVYKLNSILPATIAVKEIFSVRDDVHARFDAISRSYQYRISLSKNPFTINSSYLIKRNLDVKSMNTASALLLNYTNFKCFSKSKTDVRTYNCSLSAAYWEKQGDELIFTIAANRFLRNMVRAIVGTLIEVGTHKIEPHHIVDIINSEDRGQAGYSVPAHGLYLMNIVYPDKCYQI